MIMLDIIILSLLCYISFFYSLRVRRKRGLNMAKTEKVLFINNYSIIKSSGKILIISLLTYYICIFGILGWSFHWIFCSYILLIINIIVLDRLLIAFYIDNKNSNDSRSEEHTSELQSRP